MLVRLGLFRMAGRFDKDGKFDGKLARPLIGRFGARFGIPFILFIPFIGALAIPGELGGLPSKLATGRLPLGLPIKPPARPLPGLPFRLLL